MYEEKNKRVLLLMPKPPYPMIDGGCIAMANSMKVWKEAGFDVHVFCLSTPKHPFYSDMFPKEWIEHKNLFHEYVDTRVMPTHLPIFLFSSHSYQARRFYSHQAAKQIARLLEQHDYDVVVFDSLYAAIYLAEIKKRFSGTVFLRSHNIEFQIWQSLRKNESQFIKRKLLLYETNRLKKWEESIYHQVDGIFTITTGDERTTREISPHIPVVTLPVSMEIPAEIKKRTLHLPLRLFHIGAMNWEPNQDAIQWFLDAWFPLLSEKFPDITFHFAGKGMPSEFKNLRFNHTYCYGEVQDAIAFMKQFDVLVVPLRHGSGLRIKILEAMALGIPVISTRKGAEGIPVIHGENILLADNPEDCMKSISQLIQTPGLYEHLSEQGIAFIQKNFSIDACVSIIHSMTNHSK
ncbi:MAG: glycosyltransferase family 4 protein [Flavobacteriales bacterium]|nr:glycosyltransferase family 4 protein [Flavobacteriales bacterium]